MTRSEDVAKARVTGKLCFVDCETTSLRHDRRAWEIAVITREPYRPDTEQSWFVASEDLDLGNADLVSLKIGRFHERHPDYSGSGDWTETTGEMQALRDVEATTRGAHLVGNVPSFDAEVLAARMRANGICPSWYYHLIDIEPLAAGWLQRHAAVLENRQATLDEATALREIARPPWKSDDLMRAAGVEPPGEGERHTALGDTRWVMRAWDVLMGGQP